MADSAPTGTPGIAHPTTTPSSTPTPTTGTRDAAVGGGRGTARDGTHGRATGGASGGVAEGGPEPVTGAAATALTAAAGAFGATTFPFFAVLGRWRGSRPLHPRGVLSTARLEIDGAGESGIPVLDTPGAHPCLARISRGVGRATGRLDIPGLALRLPGAGPEGADADLLLAATGLGPVSRHVLAVRRRLEAGPVSTLWPYLTPAGPTMIAAHPLGRVDESDPRGARFALGWARSRGSWHRAGILTLDEPRADDLRFDGVERPLRDARQYPWVEAIRLPAYAGARAGWHVAGGPSPRRG